MTEEPTVSPVPQVSSTSTWRTIGWVLGINLGVSLFFSGLAGMAEREGFFVVLGIFTFLIAVPVNIIALIVAFFIKASKGYKFGFALAIFVVPLFGLATCSGLMPPLRFQ